MDKAEKANRLAAKGDKAMEERAFPEALEFYQKALAIDREVNNAEAISKRLSSIGDVYLIYVDFKKARASYNEALEIRRTLRSSEGIAESLLDIGALYARVENRDKAVAFHNEALEILREINKPEPAIESLLKIGGTNFMARNTLDDTKFYLNWAIKLGKEFGLKRQIADAYYSLAISYMSLEPNNQDSIISFLNESKGLYKELGERRREMDILQIVASLQSSSEKYNDAIISYNELLRHYRELDQPDPIGITLIQIGEQHLIIGRYDDALASFNEAAKIIEDSDIDELMSFISFAFSELYEKLEDYKKSDKYFEEGIKYYKVELKNSKSAGITNELIDSSIENLRRKRKEQRKRAAR